MFRHMRGVWMLSAAVLSASCTLGPDYRRPPIETPANFRGADTQATPASLADLKWFELFDDPQLTELITAALDRNFEVRIAAERVLQARAAYGISRSDRFPSVDAAADANAVRSSEVGAIGTLPPDADTSVTYLQAGFAVGWELTCGAGYAA